LIGLTLTIGWTKADCPDEQRLSDVGQKMSDAAKAIHGKEYDSIKSIDLYATTGAASDWYQLHMSG
jgi:hypothetical protein